MMCFFFFKQKTAYEMRISDWSSDVCSSDLAQAVSAALAKGEEAGCPVVAAVIGATGELAALLRASGAPFPSSQIAKDKANTAASFRAPTTDVYEKIGRASCRERVCQYV